MLKVNNKDTRATLIEVVLVFLLLILNIFRTFFDASFVHIEHVFVSRGFTWANMNSKNENCWKLTFCCQFFSLFFSFVNFIRKFPFCSLDIFCTFFGPKLIFQNFKYTFWFFADMSCLSAISHSHNFFGCN